jgi:hypothetical protein
MNLASDDFDLIDNVCGRLIDKEREEGISRLSEHERMVCDIWGALGLLENGSFQYFFENDMDADAVANSFDRLGFPAVAACVRAAKERFPKEIEKGNWNQMLAFMQDHEEEFDSLAAQVLQQQNEIQASLAAYIRSRPEFFVGGMNSGDSK